MEFDWNRQQETAYIEAVEFAQGELNPDQNRLSPDSSFNVPLWKKCAEFGVQGWCMPQKFGGSARDIVTTVRCLEGIGYGCRDNALTLALNGQIWSVQEPLLQFGSEQQKNHYLTQLCAGELIAAHGMTEPDSGSDAFSLKSSATRVDGGYVLNGQKSYIGLSPVAGLALIFAKTNLELGQWGISAFLVESDFKGYSASPPRAKMGLNSNPLGDISLVDCFVPDENRLGPEGIGVSLFNQSMDWERGFIFASHVGAMVRQLETCIEYARKREQFGNPIGKFQSISNRIADMSLRVEQSRLMLYKTAWLKGQGKPAGQEAAMTKLQIGEAFVQNSMDAMRIFGAKGYLSEFEIEKDLRDACGGVIYSGSSDIQRNIIAAMRGL